ncbi:hypothetical protein JW905_01390 [bacterium]|nr:hypothetical protein [candidate division CSSED10-310 bacterium]
MRATGFRVSVISRYWIVIPVVIILLALLQTWPIPVRYNTHVICDSVSGFNSLDGDPWLFIWNFHHVRLWLQGLEPKLFHTDGLFAPMGMDLSYHTLSLFNSVPGALLLPVFGPAATYNSMFLLQTLLTLTGMYLLGRQLGLKRIPAVFAAWLFTASPARTSHVSQHLNILSTGMMPFALLYLLHWRQRRRPAYLAAAAFCTALATYCSLYHGLALVLLVLAAAAVMLVRFITSGQPKEVCRLLWAFIGFCLLTGIMIAPRIIPMLGRTSLGYRSSSHVLAYTPGLDDLASIPWTHPLRRGEMTTSHRIETQITPGITLLLAGLAAFFTVSPVRRILALGAVFFILALGPCLVIDGIPIHLFGRSIPLPFALLRFSPGGGTLRCPGRFAITGALLIAVGIAGALQHWWRTRSGLVSVAAGLMVVELWSAPLPVKIVPTWSLPTSGRPEDGIALPVPADYTARRYMLDQVQHGMPLLIGFAARIEPHLFLRYEDFPVLEMLRDAEGKERYLDALGTNAFADLCTMLGVRRLLWYGELMDECIGTGELESALNRRLLMDRIDRSDRVTMVEFTPATKNFELAAAIRYYFGLNWYGEERWRVEGNELAVRWTRGGAGRICVFPNEPVIGLSCKIMPVPLERCESDTLRIAVDGQEVYSGRLNQGWNDVTLPIMAAQSMACVDFEYGCHGRPWFDSSVTTDQRDLGIALSELRFTATTPRLEREK